MVIVECLGRVKCRTSAADTDIVVGPSVFIAVGQAGDEIAPRTALLSRRLVQSSSSLFSNRREINDARQTTR